MKHLLLRKRPLALGLAALAIVSLLGLAYTVGVGRGPAPAQAQGKLGRPGHRVYVPTRGEWAKLKRTHQADGPFAAVQGAQGAGNLTYHGGPVQHSPTTYVIFWGPGWSGSAAAKIIQSYFGDVGGTSFENILTQYSDTSGHINNVATLGGVWFDGSTPTTDTSCGGPTVQDASLQSEVSTAIAQNSWPTDGSNAVYMVYTPSGYLINDGTGDCNAPAGNWCAYHSWSPADGVAYGAMPYPDDAGCQVTVTPNGDLGGDSEVNLSSHEEFETISDPQLSAWYDAAGYEIGDKCAWDFSGGQTHLNNGGTFEVQTEYSNASSSCVNSYGGSTPTTTQLLANPGFESGQTPWLEYSSGHRQLISTSRPHTGKYSAYLCGYNNCNDQIYQKVTLPATTTKVVLSYWLYLRTGEAAHSACHDYFYVHVRTSTGTTISTVQTKCNSNANNAWVQYTFDLTSLLGAYKGKQIQVHFQGKTNGSLPSYYYVDDVALNVTH